MLRQKYIGETKHYEVDELFISKIRDMPKPIGLDIAMQIDEVASDLPVLDFWQQNVAGVSHINTDPFFFRIEYLHQEDDTPIFFDIYEIDVDEYLDLYNTTKIIKLNGNINTDELLGEDNKRRATA
jgi:hypothetical protein